MLGNGKPPPAVGSEHHWGVFTSVANEITQAEALNYDTNGNNS